MCEEELHVFIDDEEVEDFANNFWGHDSVELTLEHVELLKQGYIIVWDNGEYTTQLTIRKGTY